MEFDTSVRRQPSLSAPQGHFGSFQHTAGDGTLLIPFWIPQTVCKACNASTPMAQMLKRRYSGTPVSYRIRKFRYVNKFKKDSIRGIQSHNRREHGAIPTSISTIAGAPKIMIYPKIHPPIMPKPSRIALTTCAWARLCARTPCICAA